MDVSANRGRKTKNTKKLEMDHNQATHSIINQHRKQAKKHLSQCSPTGTITNRIGSEANRQEDGSLARQLRWCADLSVGSRCRRESRGCLSKSRRPMPAFVSSNAAQHLLVSQLHCSLSGTNGPRTREEQDVARQDSRIKATKNLQSALNAL